MKHARFEAEQDKAGFWRIRVRAKNGRIVGPTEGYTGGPRKALRAIEALDRAVQEARQHLVAFMRHGEQLDLLSWKPARPSRR